MSLRDWAHSCILKLKNPKSRLTGFPKLGIPFGGPNNRDYRIWVSIFGIPWLRKLLLPVGPKQGPALRKEPLLAGPFVETKENVPTSGGPNVAPKMLSSLLFGPKKGTPDGVEPSISFWGLLGICPVKARTAALRLRRARDSAARRRTRSSWEWFESTT